MQAAYAERDKALQDFGFSCYSTYLRSPLWAGIRERVLERCNSECVCGAKAVCVHHLDYDKDTLRGKRYTGLVAVCWLCHQAAEVDSNGRKRSLEEANVLLRPAPRSKPTGTVDVNEQAKNFEIRRANQRSPKRRPKAKFLRRKRKKDKR